MRQKIILTLSDHSIVGKINPDSDDVYLLCDTTNGGFTVTLPDCMASLDIVLNFKCIGANALRVQALPGQYIEFSTYYDLNRGDLISIWPDLNKIWWILDSTSGIIAAPLIIGDSEDNTTIEEDGTVKFNGAATVWDDINMGAVSLGAGASAPDLITLGGGGNTILVRGFDGNAIAEQLFDDIEITHGYKEETDIVCHVHWMPTTTNAGDVKWQLTYAWTNRTGGLPSETTISVVQAAGGVAWVPHRADFPAISGTGKGIGSHLSIRLFRDPTDAADTYPDDAALQSFGVHYEIDTVGSRGITSK